MPPIPEARRRSIEFQMGHDPQAALRRDLDKARALLDEMIGLDKGPDEDEYGEWEARVAKFLGYPRGV